MKSLAESEAIDLGTLMAWEQAPTNLRRVQAAGFDLVLSTSKLPGGIGGRSGFHGHLRTAIEHGFDEFQLPIQELDEAEPIMARVAELLG